MDKQKRKGWSSNKAYYQKRARKFTLEAGMTGFMCTCNFRETDCVRDAYRILEEFANGLYGDEKTENEVKYNGDKEDNNKEETKQVDADEADNDEEDISVSLNKEIAGLKADVKKSPYAKRFQNADAGVKNVIFISTTLPDPLELALSIIKKVDETKQQKTRYLLRLLPIQVVCKTKMSEIKEKANALFEKYFVQEPKTFCIVFNRRFNNVVQRTEVIEELAELISKKNPGNKANLKNPEIAVVVEILRGFCLISIAPDYFKYKKYNLIELCNVKGPEEPAKDADGSPEFDEEDKSEEKKADCEEPEDETAKETANEAAPKTEGDESDKTPKESSDVAVSESETPKPTGVDEA